MALECTVAISTSAECKAVILLGAQKHKKMTFGSLVQRVVGKIGNYHTYLSYEKILKN